MGGYSFAKSARLLKPADFTKVRKTGRRVGSKRFTLYILPNGLTTHRLGLSVSRRVGAAVVRNKLKRLLREYFRLHLLPLAAKGTAETKAAETVGRVKGPGEALIKNFSEPSDILIVAKSAEGIKGLRDVEAEVNEALSRVHSASRFKPPQ